MWGTVRKRLDVVDDGGRGVDALNCGEGWLDPRHRAFTFEAREQAGLVARDVAAGAALQDDLEVESGAFDVLADEATRVRVGQRLRESFCTERELAAQVEEGVMRLDRVRRDHDPFDELMGVALDEHVVFEGGRLAFVAVHREVAREDVLGQERPLLAGAEPRAPRPRRPESMTCLTMSSGALSNSVSSVAYVPFASAASIVHEFSG